MQINGKTVQEAAFDYLTKLEVSKVPKQELSGEIADLITNAYEKGAMDAYVSCNTKSTPQAE